MQKLYEESNIQAIADAIRTKNGLEETYTTAEMAGAIETIPAANPDCNGRHVPDEALHFTGVCKYRFSDDGLNWLIEQFGDAITTKDITNVEGMFSTNSLSKIPFDINLAENCYYLQSMFDGAECLLELPAISVPETFKFNQVSYGNLSYMFRNCNCLRRLGESSKTFFSKLYNQSNLPYGQMFYYCNTLDEAVGLPVGNYETVKTSNMFSLTFNHCYRIKEIAFVTENGTPYERQWKRQTIDLSSNAGWGLKHITSANPNPISQVIAGSDIHPSKNVYDDASYQALKDDADWFTADVSYSRYNRLSAVNTIQSLPDTSVFLSTTTDTNTIKFKGEAGSKTDGGAINTMTEEEIAVATAKGWTVTFV